MTCLSIYFRTIEVVYGFIILSALYCFTDCWPTLLLYWFYPLLIYQFTHGYCVGVTLEVTLAVTLEVTHYLQTPLCCCMWRSHSIVYSYIFRLTISRSQGLSLVRRVDDVSWWRVACVDAVRLVGNFQMASVRSVVLSYRYVYGRYFAISGLTYDWTIKSYLDTLQLSTSRSGRY